MFKFWVFILSSSQKNNKDKVPLIKFGQHPQKCFTDYAYI